MKVPYVCGPLTELPPPIMDEVKAFYSRIGDLIGQLSGHRAFVPHEHYDPIKFAHFTPTEIDVAERHQVCQKTSLLIAINVAPSWGSGIEVEMARQSNVPAVILSPSGKKISRLLLGNPAIKDVVAYDNYDHALENLEEWIAKVFDVYWPLTSEVVKVA